MNVPAYMAAHVLLTQYGRIRAIVGRYEDRLAFAGDLDGEPWPVIHTEVSVRLLRKDGYVIRTDDADPQPSAQPGHIAYRSILGFAASNAVKAYLGTASGRQLVHSHLEVLLDELDARIFTEYGFFPPSPVMQSHRADILRALLRRMVDDSQIVAVGDRLAEQWRETAEALIEKARATAHPT